MLRVSFLVGNKITDGYGLMDSFRMGFGHQKDQAMSESIEFSDPTPTSRPTLYSKEGRGTGD